MAQARKPTPAAAPAAGNAVLLFAAAEALDAALDIVAETFSAACATFGGATASALDVDDTATAGSGV